MMLSFRLAGASSRIALATFLLIESLRRLPTSTATSYILFIFSSLLSVEHFPISIPGGDRKPPVVLDCKKAQPKTDKRTSYRARSRRHTQCVPDHNHRCSAKCGHGIQVRS